MTDKRQLATLLIAVLGLVVSLYLTFVKLTNSPIVCGFGSCEVVQASPYANFLGIPIAFLGVSFYLILFILAYYQNTKILKSWTLLGLLFSVYLTGIEVFVIKAICFWCVISALLATSAFLLATSLKEA
ncbi:MAG: vitamin K epoxide reductase family protein [Patescibacteria group bacterium]